MSGKCSGTMRPNTHQDVMLLLWVAELRLARYSLAVECCPWARRVSPLCDFEKIPSYGRPSISGFLRLNYRTEIIMIQYIRRIFHFSSSIFKLINLIHPQKTQLPLPYQLLSNMHSSIVVTGLLTLLAGSAMADFKFNVYTSSGARAFHTIRSHIFVNTNLLTHSRLQRRFYHNHRPPSPEQKQLQPGTA